MTRKSDKKITKNQIKKPACMENSWITKTFKMR